MNPKPKRMAASAAILFATAFSLAAYFGFAAIQGDFGLFRRIQILAEEDLLTRQLAQLKTEVAVMENRTHRLSDHFLDLDLLDEQARRVLGLVRGDEIIIR